MLLGKKPNKCLNTFKFCFTFFIQNLNFPLNCIKKRRKEGDVFCLFYIFKIVYFINILFVCWFCFCYYYNFILLFLFSLKYLLFSTTRTSKKSINCFFLFLLLFNCFLELCIQFLFILYFLLLGFMFYNFHIIKHSFLI